MLHRNKTNQINTSKKYFDIEQKKHHKSIIEYELIHFFQQKTHKMSQKHSDRHRQDTKKYKSSTHNQQKTAQLIFFGYQVNKQQDSLRQVFHIYKKTKWQKTKRIYNNTNKFAKKAFVDIITTIF